MFKQEIVIVNQDILEIMEFVNLDVNSDKIGMEATVYVNQDMLNMEHVDYVQEIHLQIH
ncbi:MAG TPA: hypothetical protein PLD02_08440 [Saprospiraceae bacterium]|jgi:hypothetical protein|nr:hypothetical protein [Saprospiraceae bacterium]